MLNIGGGLNVAGRPHLALDFFKPQIHVVEEVMDVWVERHYVLEAMEVGSRICGHELLVHVLIAELMQHTPRRRRLMFLCACQ